MRENNIITKTKQRPLPPGRYFSNDDFQIVFVFTDSEVFH